MATSASEDPIVDDFESTIRTAAVVDTVGDDLASGAGNVPVQQQQQPKVLNLYIKSSTAKVVDKSIAFKLKQSGVTNTSKTTVAETERLGAMDAPVIHVGEDWTIGGFGVWCAEDETYQACHVDSSLYMSRKRTDLAALADAVTSTVASPHQVIIHVTAKHAELSKMTSLASGAWKSFCDSDNVDLLQQIQLSALVRETMGLPAAQIKEWTVQDVEHDATHGIHHAHSLARKAVTEGKLAVQSTILQHLQSVVDAAQHASPQFSTPLMEETEETTHGDTNSVGGDDDDTHDCIDLNELIAKPIVRHMSSPPPAATTFRAPKINSDNATNTSPNPPEVVVIRHKASSQRLFPVTVVKPRARKQRAKKDVAPIGK